MRDSNTSKWTEGLRFVQFTKNRALHSGIQRSPYEAMFGGPARVGLESTSLPKEISSQLQTEEDLEKALKEMYELDRKQNVEPEEEEEEEEEEAEAVARETLKRKREAVLRERQDASTCLQKQAKKMKRDSDAKFPEPSIGSTARVPLPDVDRGKTDAR